MAVATHEPSRITAGSTVRWSRTLADYPASSWVLKYALVPQQGELGRVEVTAQPSGDSHAVELSASATADIEYGVYTLFGYVEQGDERHMIFEEIVIVEPNPVTATALDKRSWARKALAKIEAALEEVLGARWQSMSVSSKNMSRPEVARLLDARDRLLGEIARERSSATGGIKTLRVIFR